MRSTASEPLTAHTLYAYLSAYRLPDLTTFTPPYPLAGVRLAVTDTRVNGTWITTAGETGPILIVENFGNGTMAVALLLPSSVTGSPTWLYSIGAFGFTSVFGGTFYLGPLSGAGLDGKDQVGLSWLSETELICTYFYAGPWIGPPPTMAMKRLKDAL